MSRVTAPSRQISRALNSAAGGAARTGNHILDHNAGAVLMPKYAELLRNRRSDSDVSALISPQRIDLEPMGKKEGKEEKAT